MSLCHHGHWWFVWWSHLNSVIEDQKFELCSQIEVFVLLRSLYYVMKARSAINYLKSTWPSYWWGSENWVMLSHYWNPVNWMSYSFVNFVTFLLSTARKCRICDIIVLNKLTLTQSKRIRVRLKVLFCFLSFGANFLSSWSIALRVLLKSS